MALLLSTRTTRRAASKMAIGRLQQYNRCAIWTSEPMIGSWMQPHSQQQKQQQRSMCSSIARFRISDRKPITSVSNASRILDTSRKESNHGNPIRVSSMQFSTTSSENNENNDNDSFDVEVDYISPLGDLISRLKMVSITGCFLSVCVMPALVFLKNGDLPNAQQATMGTVATLGAVGSTAALHFVFGAYVLEMKSIQASDNNNDNNHSAPPKTLLHAKTRSVFGFWNEDHVFDPTQDVKPYQGNRPFANFMVDGQPLYVHPEKLDSVTRQWLLLQPSKSASTTETTDSEGLATKNKKKKDEDDDELF